METLILTLNDIYELKNLPRLATIINRMKSSYPDHIIIIVVNGDFLAPSILSSLDFGLNMVKAFNRLGVTHVCLGNHEFDNKESINILKDNAKFKVINSNIEGLSWTYPYDVVNGVLIVGGCLDMLNNPPGIVNPVNETLIKVKNSVIDGYKYTLALTHQDYEDDMKLKGHFDIVMGGHDHDLMITHPVYKMGMDADYLGVYHVENGKFWMYNTREYEEDYDMLNFVNEEELAISSIAREAIILFDKPLSTKNIRTKQSSLVRWIFDTLNDQYNANGYIINSGSFRLEKTFNCMSLKDFRGMFPINVTLHLVEMDTKTIRSCIKEGISMSGDGMYTQYGFTNDYDENYQGKQLILISDYMLKTAKTYKCLKRLSVNWYSKEMPNVLYMILTKHRDHIIDILKEYYNTEEQSQIYQHIKEEKQLAILFNE